MTDIAAAGTLTATVAHGNTAAAPVALIEKKAAELLAAASGSTS